MMKKFCAVLAAALIAAFFLPAAGGTDVVAVCIDAAQEERGFRLAELQPAVRPLMFMSEGKWLVEPVNMDPEEAGRALAAYRAALASLNEKLRPLPAFSESGEFLVPKAVLSPLFIKTADGTFGVGGWYSRNENAVVLTLLPLREGKAAAEHALAHELGHWVWARALTEAEREQYRKLVGDVPNLEERFAEDFRLFAVGMPSAGERWAERTPAARGDPAALRRFFSRFAVETAPAE